MTALFDGIRRLADRFGDVGPEGELDTSINRELSLGLAEALGWTAGSAHTRTNLATTGMNRIGVARGFVGAQPAAVFVAGPEVHGDGLMETAALYAYHAAIPWGLAADARGPVVFNSHWVRDGEWFHLPRIPWDDVREHIDIFEAFTPEGLTEGRLERVATEHYKPDDFLRPVDDELVARLDSWRAETLRHVRRTSRADERLQTLYAQFFVLRTVEDRGLAQELPALSTAIGSRGEADVDALKAIFKGAQHYVGSELFEVDVPEDIPQSVLGGIIRDLYHPRQLPGASARYNFAWMDADVLGTAYEKYLSTILVPAPPEAQLGLGLFDQPLREVERISVRKAGGVYYTPPYLVRYLAERAVERALGPESEFDPERLPRIADFACGSGAFLVAAFDVLIRRLKQRDPNRKWIHEIVAGKHILGVDIDEKAVTFARTYLWQRFTEEPEPLPLPRLSEIIVQGDSLGDEVWEDLPRDYNVVLGNPPFLATGRAPSREDLAKFRTAQGRFDYSYLFVELAVSKLVPEGVLGLVVPNRLFRNRDAGTIREILTTETDLLSLVDFGAHEVFPGTSAYIGTIIARKRAPGALDRAQRVRVINVKDLSPNMIGALLERADELEGSQRNDSLDAFETAHPRGSGPWILLSAKDIQARARLEEASVRLRTLALVAQGIRTGSNDIFIVNIESGATGSLARVVNGLGQTGLVETTLLRPVIFGSEIQRYDLVTPTQHLLYPYRGGVAIPEAELKETYPRAYEYLSTYREILAGRASIADSTQRWYELVRRRDESWLTRPKLLIRDLATETSFALDRTGTTFLVGGTAVIPHDAQVLLPLVGYLNSRLVNGFLGQITPLFKRGFQKFEPRHLEEVPVLRRVLEDEELSEELATLTAAVLRARATGDSAGQRGAEEAIERALRAALDAGPIDTDEDDVD